MNADVFYVQVKFGFGKQLMVFLFYSLSILIKNYEIL